jgi:phosphoribosylaminoimidazolecarboxamide formyltransferase/IMP cyclohydrolase
MAQRKIARALLSVSDKTGLADFARALRKQGVAVVSTGGTAKALREAGIAVTDVAEITQSPEMLDGRVKTLHPRIHGGLLAVRGNAEHERALAEHAIPAIDLLAVNLYPFEKTVAGGADFATCIENIDIGGPALIRAAAKNHDFVTVLVDPADYGAVVEEMAAHQGATTLETRRRLARQAYARTAAYDAAISRWMAEQAEEKFPPRISFTGTRSQVLRYGENPHQEAAVYLTGEKRPGIALGRQLQGKELSYNNFNDADAAFELVAEFDEGAAIAIIKHANPCGVATGSDLKSAYLRALACDPVSAFGGIIAANRVLDGTVAEEIAKIFSEVIIAPGFTPEALSVLGAKKNLRLVETGGMPSPATAGLTARTIAGALLVQTNDAKKTGAADLKVVTKRAPSAGEIADLLFAFKVAKHAKSNAIVYAKNGATVGVGAGQMSRVDSARIAAWKAAEAAKTAGDSQTWAKGSVVASDAFFPFADGLLAAAEAGATAVIQPGGSMRDDDVIKAADEAGLAMVFTGIRHFRH